MDSSLDQATWVLAGITALLVLATFVTVGFTAWARSQDIKHRNMERLEDQKDRKRERTEDKDAQDALLAKVEGMATEYIKQATELVSVTRSYTDESKRLADENQAMVAEMAETRHTSQLPVLIPISLLDRVNGKDAVDWNTRCQELRVANSGAGLATEICGIVMAPKAVPTMLNERFSIIRGAPLRPGEERNLIFQRGGTSMDGATTVGPNPLEPPEPDSNLKPLGLARIYEARLTLTYRDVFGRKHVASFDYSHLNQWENATFTSGIATDLVDIDLEMAKVLAGPAFPAGSDGSPTFSSAMQWLKDSMGDEAAGEPRAGVG